MSKGEHEASDIEEIGAAIKGAKRYFLQNFRSGNMLDPSFEGRPFTASELEELLAVAKKHVPDSRIRN